ncbi:HAD family hydrolase [Candidatus Woesearchaeota archaeon]|nr:HAD family hydrolase [Candidatus Woesearchaeota archaeon]
MIRLVVFDWNGTLFSDTHACMGADNHVIKSFGGRPVSLKAYRETIIIPSNTFYARHGCKTGQLLKNNKQVGEIFSSFYEELAKTCRARKGAQQLLAWLHSHSIGCIILSNHTVKGIAFQLRRLNLSRYIAHVLANDKPGTSMIKRNKLQKLREYIRKKHHRASDVLIVGDSPEESEIGKRLGIKSVLIKNGFYATSRLKKSRPDFIIDDLKELKKIIAG